MGGSDLILHFQLQSRRKDAGHIAHSQHTLGFVDRDEILHPVSEALRQHAGIFREPVRHLIIQPPAFFLQAGGQVPVKDRHPGTDAVFQQAVDQPVIERCARFIHFAGTFRQDPRPGYGEPVVPDPVLCHQGHIFLIPVIMVAGGFPVGPVQDLPGQGAVFVPDARAFSVLVPGALDLEGSRCRTPDKIIPETHIHSPFCLKKALSDRNRKEP